MRPELPVDLSQVEHHPVISGMVDVLTSQTNNSDRKFFTTLGAFFVCKVATNMGAVVRTKDERELPVNCYAVALATSGFGKGKSIYVIEEEILKGFFERFLGHTLPNLVKANLFKIANDRHARGPNPAGPVQETLDKVEKEYAKLGAFVTTYDSGTPEGTRQLRSKIQMGGGGALTLQIDEIGSNLIKNSDLLTLFLELWDQGLIKDKVTKSSDDNKRVESLGGKTPTNALLFGTGSKLFDGAVVEKEFLSFLGTGYARRCLFANGISAAKEEVTAEELYARLTATTNSQMVQRLATHFSELADPARYGWTAEMTEEGTLLLLRYLLACEKAAERLPEHDETRRAELNHRYSKALKLAGALAFVDGSPDVEVGHVEQAMKVVEESGEAFHRILVRDKPYQKLAKYLATCEVEQTHSDLDEALPFYPDAKHKREDMHMLASAWGYGNNIAIERSYGEGGIELFKGIALKETDISAVTFSVSGHFAYEYQNVRLPFSRLPELVLSQQDNGEPYHWLQHHLADGDLVDENGDPAPQGHRKTENVIPGFDLIVLDVDGEFPLASARELFKEWTYLIHTTASHGKVCAKNPDGGDRYRIILPTNYRLVFGQDKFREFMDNLHAWLPWKLKDEGSNRIAQKWTTYPGSHWLNEGDLFDVTPFIPKTTRNEALKASAKELKDLPALERYFAQRMGPEGSGRNNNMIAFALALVDTKMGQAEIEARIRAFDKKLPAPLGEAELAGTIFRTVAKECASRGKP